MGILDPSVFVNGSEAAAASFWANSILEHLPYPTFVADIRSDRLVYTNPAFENDPHLSPEAMKSRGREALFEVFHPDDFERVGALHRTWIKESSDRDFVAEYRLKSPTGKWIWYQSTHRVLQRDARGYVQLILVTSQDITERKHLQDAIYNVATGVSAATGDSFFNKLVEHIALVLDADYAFVGELPENGVPCVYTLAAFGDGAPMSNFEYDLRGTPCADVLGNPVACVYPKDVQDLYPGDAWLVNQHVQGYAGNALRDSTGKAIGILIALTRGEFSDPSLAESVLEIFASRAGAELERRCAERDLQGRVRFEEAAAQLASDLLDVDLSALPEVLTRGLGPLAKLWGVDRVAVVRREEGPNVPFVYRWDRTKGGERFSNPDTVESSWPWFFKSGLSQEGILAFETMDELPPEAAQDRRTALKLGVRSIAFVPSNQGRNTHLAISAMTLDRHRSWDAETLRRLQFVGDLIAHALNRTYVHHAFTASEQEFRSLFDSFDHPITIFNSEGRILLMNEPGARNLGGTPGDFIGRTFEEAFPELHEMALRRYAEVVQSPEGCRYEDRLELPNGIQWFWSHLRAIPWRSESSPVVQYVSYEISDLKHAQTQQQEQQDFNVLVSDEFAELLQAEPAEIHDSVQSALRKIAELVNIERIAFFARSKRGNSPDPVLWSAGHLAPWTVTDPTVAAQQWQWLREGVLDGGRFAISRFDDYVFPSEERRRLVMQTGYRSVAGQLITDADGLPVLMAYATETFEHPWEEDTLVRLRIFGEMICTALQRVRLMEDVALNEERLRLAMQGGDIGIWDMTLDPPLVSSYGRLIRDMGYEEETYVLTEDRNPIHPTDYPRVQKQFLETLKGNSEFFQVEYRLFNRNAQKYAWIVSRARVVERDANGKAVRMAGTHQDITVQKDAEAALQRREKELRQAQKMEAVGQLAGGIAHDFNNLLQAIHGFNELTLTNYDLPAGARENLSEVSVAAEQAADLVRQLLTFTRQDEARFRIVALNGLLSGIAKLLHRVIRKDIELDIQADPDLPPVWADSGNITQVVINLCVNARDAMPSGGDLGVSAFVAELTENDCAGRDWVQPGTFVCIEVRDTGTGIPPEHYERIFEPFFTTKEPGEGTGLGLAMAYAVAQHHHGLLTVDSVPSLATVFRLYLPVVSEEASTKERELRPVESDAGGNATILLAEDEELVRRLTVQILESQGYQVLVANNGQEAIELFELHKTSIDAAILDVIMPKRSGHEVCDAIREDNSDIPILFTTGYTHEALTEREAKLDNVHLLRKPYQPDKLLETLRSILSPAHAANVEFS